MNLEELDLEKEDPELGSHYLVLMNGTYHTGIITKEWHGLVFMGWGNSGLPLNPASKLKPTKMWKLPTP